MDSVSFDARDQEILEKRMVARELIAGPRNGDYVRFPSGEIERFSHNWGDALQTSPVRAGSFYLHDHGEGSFSGSLNPAIPASSLSLSDEKMEGGFWFFHHGQAGAGRGVRFKVPCRVYDTKATYGGFVRAG